MSRTHRLAAIALMAAVMALLSPITLPTLPIPFSLSVFAVALTAALLPPGPAMGSLVVYLLLGFAGLPVFSGFRGGPAVLLGPTGGYILGYFLLVPAVSLAAGRLRRPALRVVCAALGLAGLYLLGTLWYMVMAGAGLWTAFSLCVLPFILPDLLKLCLAFALARMLKNRMEKAGVRL